jgi:hypothetical protein
MLSSKPAEIVVDAQILGLRALVDLLRERTTKDTRHFYTQAQERFQSALEEWQISIKVGNPNFNSVAKEEKHLRNLELENIWETTASYGNAETKRVRSEKDGAVGPLNKFINIFGGELRNYFLLMHPFEPPVKIGKQKSKTVWGYHSKTLGDVPVAHGADLPELDLADMVRSYGRELCRKSFTFGVHKNDFNAYSLLLIRRLSSYVDHVYTNGQCGSVQFLRSKTKIDKKTKKEVCAIDVLREIVDELGSLYGRGAASLSPPSRVQEKRRRHPTKKFFTDQITKLRRLSGKKPREKKELLTWTKFLKTLTDGKKPKLRDRDAQHLYEIVRNIARYEGDKCHRFLTDGLPQVYRAESVILNGNQFLETGEDTLIVGESRIRTDEGPGRIDLALFIRTEVPNPNRPGKMIVMKPIAVFEIKTRTGFNWEIKTKKTRGKRKKTVVRFIVRKRVLTDDEWTDALTEVPSKSAAEQLNLYASGLVREYRRLTGNESVKDVLRGVVLVDTQFDVNLNREVVRSFLKDFVSNQILRGKIGKGDRLLIRSKSPMAKRAALVLFSSDKGEYEVLKSERKSLDSKVLYNPFSKVEDSSSRHVIYLSARSASNSGFTSAWIARYWHGMRFLQQLSEENGNKPVVWLDLTGDFSERSLARVRLRMQHQDTAVETFFDNIKFINLSTSVERFLFRGANLPDISASAKWQNKIVVVSGWDWIEKSTPLRLKSALAELERYMVQEIHRTGCPSVWFLEPRPDERTSEIYHTRCLIPFWESLPHQCYVTDIVWNLPIRPYTSVQTTPMLDDLRVIVHQTKETVETEAIEFPLLKDWSARFWSKRSKRKTRKSRSKESKGRVALTPQEVLGSSQFSKDLILDSIDLIPWLRDLWPQDFAKTSDEVRQDIRFETTTLYGKPSPRSGIMSRMIYRAKIKGARGKMGHATSQELIPKESITHPRHYRSYRRIKRTTLNAQSYNAPDERLLEFRQFREQTAQNVEIRRLRQTLALLSKKKEAWTSEPAWQELLKQLKQIVLRARTIAQTDDINKITELLRINDISSNLWNSLLWTREARLGTHLRLCERDHLRDLLESKPYVTTSFGNYLFLLLLAISRKYPELTIEQIQQLWGSVKAWHLRQIGFYLRKIQGEHSEPKFDVRAVWSNLCKRANVLTKMVLPVQSSVRYGQLLIAPHGDDHDYWVFIEDRFDKSRFQSGLIIGQNPFASSAFMRWTEMDNHEIALHAKSAVAEEAYDLLVSNVSGVECIWLFAEGEWNLQGELIIVPRKKDAITSIRGIQIKPFVDSQTPEVPVGVRKSPTINHRVREELSQIARLRKNILSVQCTLGIDSGMYTIRFEAEREQIDMRVVHRTSDLLHILRMPLVEGIPLQSSQDPDVYLTWNPYEDVDYGELQLLRPYVERKTPYVHVRMPLPLTSRELLERPPAELKIVISHDESECPIIDGGASAHGSCWRVRVKDRQESPCLAALTDDALSEIDISSLINAGEVFLEEGRYRLNIEFEKDYSSREGYVFRESRLLARQLGVRPIPAGTFLELGSEQLKVILVRDGYGVEITLRSTLTDERLDSAVLVPPEGRWNVDSELEDFKTELEGFVKEYFGEDEGPETRIVNYDEVVTEMRDKLRSISKTKRSRKGR